MLDMKLGKISQWLTTEVLEKGTMALDGLFAIKEGYVFYVYVDTFLITKLV